YFPFYFPVSSDSLYADSVVLVLSYKSVWGDSTQPLSLRVFEILNDGDSAHTDLDADSLYKTDREITPGLELTENNAAKLIYPTTLNDSVYPYNEQAKNQLRIRLNTSYATDRLFKLDTATVLGSDSLYELRGPKGYQIIAENVGNALLRINLTDTNTKLAVYFRYKDRTTAGKMDTTVRYFKCNQYSCGSTNYIKRDRSMLSGVQTAKAWLPPANNGSVNDSLVFIDGNPGIYARLQIPGLSA